MGETDEILKRARQLFNEGDFEEAEALLQKVDQTDAAVLNFRAYLLYKQGRHEEAAEAYGRLAQIDAGDPSPLMNLGLIHFKLNRIARAREAFEKVLALQPGDVRTLRNLGYCCRRLGHHREAEEYFCAAGETAEDTGVPGGGPGEDGAPENAAGAGGRNITGWMKQHASTARERRDESYTGEASEVFFRLDEKMYLNSRYLLSYRGVIVFSPMSREARKGASRFGDRNSEIVRVEGTGDLGITARGRGLHTFQLDDGESLFVNYAALVMYDDGVEAAPDFDLVIRKSFLALSLKGEGKFMLALKDPAVLRIPEDYPAYVRPAAVVAWTGNLSVEAEAGPVAAGTFGKKEEGRFLRFEGDGHLLLQTIP